MKKIITIFLSTILIFVFITSCNKTKEETPETIPNHTTESTVVSSEDTNKNAGDSESSNATPVSDFKYESNENGGITITEYLGKDTEIIFPSKIDDKNVTEITFKSWINIFQVETVVIPDTVTHIGKLVFSHCSNLKSITLSKNLKKIGSGAFFRCSSLNKIEFPSTLEAIDSGAFEECTGLSDVKLPQSLTFIGARAFYNCISLKHITIPGDCLNEYSWDAFACSGLETVILEAGVKMIPTTVFFGTNITSISLPQSVESIAYAAFGDCKKLESVELNQGLRSMDSAVFANTKITELVIPSTITEINEMAFTSCKSLEKVTFEGDAPSAYLYSNEVTVIDVPKNVHYTIYYHENANGFTSPIWNGYKTQMIGAEPTEIPTYHGFEYLENEEGNITIFSYIGSESEVIIPQQIDGENVTRIGARAFKYNNSIVSIVIPDTVTVIDQSAFYCCSALENVQFSNTLTSIETAAFFACSSLKTVTFPDSLYSIGKDAFSNGRNLETIVLNHGLANIEDGAFAYADKLTEVIIPSTVESMTEYAFVACRSLQKMKFEGDAPNQFRSTNPDEQHPIQNYTIYYHSNAEGFSSPQWNGYPTEIW